MTRPLAVITGASSGIGEVFARRLAADHDLLLVARRKDRLESLGAELSQRHGSSVEILAADLAEEKDLAIVENRIGTEERLVLLVNNAGFGTKGLFWEAALEGQEKMYALHVTATMRLCHAALRAMVPADRGGIVNVASVAAFVRRAGGASYGSTKSWMAVFTEALYLELRSVRSHVAVQALCPGFTITEFHDTMQVTRESMAASSFWMTAEQVVDASLKGLRQRRLFVVPGWRYRAIVALVSKLPVSLRLAIESRISREQSK
jgi:uncharacterized protein